ncbi:hypothetical protein BKA70DRAFT_1222038 [Coprinopsis sp. MPI-PUGE-AT-0042]|nr:hypothetical protein BKA70DRAFT_1222038 [Coprinopsis sp. MPI-PUGE-AT-0042]
MASSTWPAGTGANQLQFPSTEPRLPGHEETPPPMPPSATPKHSRSTSFFAAFRSSKTHQRNISAPPSGDTVVSVGRGKAAPTATKLVKPSQHHSHPPSNNTVIMGSVRQPGSSGFQQQLPPLPPQQQQQGQLQQSQPPPQPIPANPQQPPPLHPEIRSVVGLKAAHAHKIYFSGPLVRKIERQPDGHAPHKDEGWTDVWAQLGGTILSIWDMKEVQEASRQGKEVPPTYVNVTDAAQRRRPPKKYPYVITLNTAGSNLLLFSCPSMPALISWASALRLAAWEKARLEEIYTAHLIRITLPSRDAPTTLVRGKLEGWARVRIAGQTDWKRVWVSVCQGGEGGAEMSRTESRLGPSPSPGQEQPKKRRMSNLFSREHSPPRSNLPAASTIFMYAGQKPKERKKPLLTMTAVTQAFAVYPERPELISRSALIKVEGLLGSEELAAGMRGREGWILLMPELEGAPPNGNLSKEMLKWLIGVHDAFGMYGRPTGWTWDPRDPVSLMFGYPVGPSKENLFMDRESVETMDPRDDRTSVIRSHLRDFLLNFMRNTTVQAVPKAAPQAVNEAPPSLPPINGLGSATTQHGGGPQLPAMNLQGRRLTPITEGGSVLTHSNTLGSMDFGSGLGQGSGEQQPLPAAQPQASGSGQNPILTREISNSPVPLSPVSTVSPAVSPNGYSGGGSYFPAMAATATRSPASTTSRLSMDKINTAPPPAVAIRPLSPNKKTATASLLSSDQSSPPTHFQQSPRIQDAAAPLPLTPRVEALSRPHTASSMSDATSNLSYAKEGENLSLNQAVRGVEPPKQSEVSKAAPSPPPAPTAAPADDNHDFMNEAGVLFMMQQQAGNTSNHNLLPSNKPLKPVTNPYSDSSESEEETSYSQPSAASQPIKNVTSEDSRSISSATGSTRQPPIRQSTPMAFVERARPSTSAINPSAQQTSVHDLASSNTSRLSNSPSPQPTQSNSEPFSGSPNYDSAGSGFADRPGRNSTFTNIGRKPSGARAPQLGAKGYSGVQVAGQFPASSSSASFSNPRLSNHREISEEEFPSRQPSLQEKQSPPSKSSTKDSTMSSPVAPIPPSQSRRKPTSSFDEGGNNAEALAALAYLAVNDDETQQPRGQVSPPIIQPSDSMKDEGYTSASNPTIAESASNGSTNFKSSFAPSKNAEERKKKAQAQQAAAQTAAHRPGRAGGKKKRPPVVAGAWGDSTDEEEEEEEEEDEDVDSDGGTPANAPPRMQQQMRTGSGQQIPQQAFGAGSVYPSVEHPSEGGYSHMRPPRMLPQPPPGGGRATSTYDDGSNLGPRRQISEQFGDGGRRTYYEDGMPQGRSHTNEPQYPTARQNVWTQVLDARATGAQVPAPSENQGRDTFVQLDTSETMTKAFTPQGLLSAGLQDKQDRSAKRQEELARETGGSLINVQSKPPPPQTGLLGAITAHERERKREGGVGAALTEREREKRVAEERQRRFDEMQRAQMDQMQAGGSVYGGQGGQFGMMNPMMNPMMMGGMNPMMGLNPMMTGGGMNPMMAGGGGLSPMMTGGGMNPMMTGGGMNPMMGYGMMGGFNPHMFAAQQAAQAYQQAMMAFSVAGSQVGGDGGNATPGGPQQQGMNPAMTGGNFDPRMSMNMMGMGMMTPQMTGPMGMQMSGGGMGQMDPRFSMAGGMGGAPGMGMNMGPPSVNVGGSPGGGGSPRGLAEPVPLRSSPLGPNGSNPANLSPGNFTPNSNSPIGRGSPLARNMTPGDSRGASPKH